MPPLEDNKLLIQRLIAGGHNRQNAVAAAALYSEDALNHTRKVGRAGMQAVFETLYAVFPDFHYTIDECTAEHTDLLEALLGKLCTRLMKLAGVVGVRIKVTKLEIFPDCQVAISAECGQW